MVTKNQTLHVSLLLILCGALTIFQTYADPHVIAHWDFNEGSGTTLNDISGNGHDGEIWGATRTDSGLVFDGVDDYVAIPDDSVFELDSNWTIEYTVAFDNAITPRKNTVFSRTVNNSIDLAVCTRSMSTRECNSEIILQWSSTDSAFYNGLDDGTNRPVHVSIVKKGVRIFFFHDSRLIAGAIHPHQSMHGSPGVLRIGALGGATDTSVNSDFARMRITELTIRDTAYGPPGIERVNGLVARWTFDDRTGDSLRDVSGNAHHGRIIEGTELIDGLFGKAYCFSGSSQITVDRDPHFNIDSTLTIMGWVRLDRPDGAGVIIDHSNRGGYHLCLEKKIFVLRSGGSFILIGSTIELDRWYHFAYTYSAGKKAFYLNGAQVIATQTPEPELLGFGDSVLSIGREVIKRSTLNYFRGAIDDLSLYDIALSADSIRSIYTAAYGNAAPDSSAPLLLLNKTEYNHVQQGRAYTEYGAQAWDGTDGELTSSVKIDNKCDTRVAGTCEVLYSVTNALGKTATIVRSITIDPDTIAPTITLDGDTVTQILVGWPYTEPGYTAVDDPTRLDLTDSVNVTSNLDTSECGTYTISYTVTDGAGLSTTATRTIHVVDLFQKNEIRCNQYGFYGSQKKTATVAGSLNDTFDLLTEDTDSIVFTGVLSDSVKNGSIDEYVKIADFSKFSSRGRYRIRCRHFGYSYPFFISDNVYGQAARSGFKTFYYQRCSYPLDTIHGGIFSRERGHSDTACFYYSDAEKTRNVTGGWYDAGDYGKYIVNAGITVGTLLSLYEFFPGCFGDSEVKIPESGNDRDDLLDEIKWELDWFKTMQDTSGGVFFKVGPTDWPGFIMPSDDNGSRYVFDMATSSTLNFAAVMAQAGRVYHSIAPAFAEDCLQRAEKAWQWAVSNPSVFAPSSGTGTGLYNDTILTDEFLWASTELFLTTGKETYKPLLETGFEDVLSKPVSWNNVGALALYSLVHESLDHTTTINKRAVAEVEKNAEAVLERINSSVPHLPMTPTDYVWGSNGIICNYAVNLGVTYVITREKKYLDGILSILDYLFGNNPLNHCFVTGFGSRSPMQPHHRISEADGITEPVPGFVVGGPNGQREDMLDYHTEQPELCYLDTIESYASNEVAINWNAPFVFATALIAHEYEKDLPVRSATPLLNNNCPKHIGIHLQHQHVRITVPCHSADAINWEVINLMGRRVLSATKNTPSARHYTLLIPLSNIGTGVYMLKVTTSTASSLKRIQVLR